MYRNSYKQNIYASYRQYVMVVYKIKPGCTGTYKQASDIEPF